MLTFPFVCLYIVILYSEPEGVWATWSAWTICDVSCGTGQQSRHRDCVSMNDTEVIAEDCIGDVDQQRECNTFECPGKSFHIIAQN